MFKSINKRYNWLFKVSFDKLTGFYYYTRHGDRIYIRHPRHYLPIKEDLWTCENLFFHYYFPKNGDQVVALGAGYGEDAIFLKKKSPNVKYLGVEAQPVIYECLANTFRELGDEFKASPYVISNEKITKFCSHFSYASVGRISDGYIEIPTLKWSDFIKRYNLQKIDLLKMNIEGAEKDLIASIDDFSIIKRLIISCHDFRADNGEGDFFRTKKIVTSILKKNGYQIKNFNYGISWSDDWIFASKE